MRYQWLNKKEGCDRRVLVFFNGWGQDSRVAAHLSADADTDVLMLYAYHDGQDFDFSSLGKYAEADVAAWSMGVWYASRRAALKTLNVRRAVALCGTPWAIDDLLGIPCGVFEATLTGLSPRSLEKFAMRMAGGAAAYRKSPLSGRNSRDFDDVRSELQWWREHYASAADDPQEGIRWQKALIGLADGIFPPENQLRAWERAAVPSVQVECPHDPLAGMSSWDEVLGF